MVFAKCTRDFYGAGDVQHRLGEVIQIELGAVLLRVGYAQEVDEGTPVLQCSCGRMFVVSTDPEKPEEFLTNHILELGKGHSKAKVKEPVVA
jgi:hypothetical protein